LGLKEEIFARARDLGFDLVGFAPADPLEGAEFYARWLAQGHAGEMEYLLRHRSKRADPAQLVPGARTVICLGFNYYQPTAEPVDPLRGRIAAYARGDDYHDVLKTRLRELWEFIRQQTDGGAEGRYYVDTAPVLERELARRAGLGWWGKNTCLINKRGGSHFFLAEIITTLSFEYDTPSVDHCGSCTRCLDACPTNAFPEPYVLDARRCISYLTIELKGAIPQPLRAGMGNWIFGCDICQDVCPWNSKAASASEPAFRSRADLDNPWLQDLIGLKPRDFNARFRRNPGKRPKRRGVLRNVAVALGNAGRAEAIPALEKALEDCEPVVRSHVAWALGRIGGERARKALEGALEVEIDAEVRAEIRSALADSEGREVE
jgi:epoxyqueuosine reductase